MGRIADATATFLITLALAAAAPGLYTGGSRRANRRMDIAIQVLAGGRRANWRADVSGPCTEHLRLGRTVGTDAGNTPQDPRLRIRDGGFRLDWHGHATLHPLWWHYVLAGNAADGGFVGTFHYTESDHRGYACNSRLLHWRAKRSAGSFP